MDVSTNSFEALLFKINTTWLKKTWSESKVNEKASKNSAFFLFRATIVKQQKLLNVLKKCFLEKSGHFGTK